MKIDFGDVWFAMSVGLLVLLGAAVMAIAIVYVPACVVAERHCLAAGYPHASVTIALERYCVKRVDQTDVVVPLSEAEMHR